MLTKISAVNCMGCSFNCPLDSENKAQEIFCAKRQFAIWPDLNQYFKRTIHELVFTELTCYLPQGVIVVDFSLDNILFFIDEEWAKKLQASGLKIVLLSEKSMLPMANFWMAHSGFSWSVVEVENCLPSVINKIKRVMQGRRLHCRRTPTLTEQEMGTLRLLARGKSSQDIARIMSCDARSVYRFQSSLCKKFGGLNRLRDLRLMHAIYATG
ncbi:helix-turn-helix transcriptional regulator [Enterobacter cloacae]|uniref:Regulatory protein LuxR n=1 Tax=Enterobacter cloacae TaxID=550 RepID=A0A144V494_ENTCL|nr:LuxR C-terminal-related transcriptional regulator [Enterobacter cloacae]CZW48550.1 regulatory protein LuxR [Enterobacter cloacae]SAH87265.1 regulatory protein LuxR [Enterobacter cloacae]